MEIRKSLILFLASAFAAPLCLTHPEHTLSHPQTPSPAAITGNGVHTYRTDPDWGKLPDGQPLGSTHGGIAISASGEIYVSTDGKRAICVFNENGEFLRSIAHHSVGLHSLTIREENGIEYLYGAESKGARIVKLTLDGKLSLEIKDTPEQPIPGSLKGVTAVAAGPDDRIYAAVGYGSNMIHIFSPEGELLKSVGSKGQALDQFKTCHGLAMDTRFEEPLLLIADRENRRLVHYDLEGNFVRVFANGLRRPCAISFFGEFAAIAELEGRVVILDKLGEKVAFLGDNPNSEQWAKFRTLPAEIPEGIFSAPHGLCYDRQGNLYVQDWNIEGRITRLSKLY